MFFFRLIMLAAAAKFQLFYVGDSITYGIGTNGYGASGSNIQGTNSYPEQCYRLLNDPKAIFYKRGYPGFRADNYVSAGKMATDQALIDKVHYRKQIAVIFFGANDIAATTDANAIYSNIVAVHNSYRALGCKTIVVTVMNRIDRGLQVDSQRQAVNALIRANWQTFADDIADLAAQPLLDATDAPQNSLYFRVDDVDGLTGVHLTDEGAALLAAEVLKPITRLKLLSN